MSAGCGKFVAGRWQKWIDSAAKKDDNKTGLEKI